MSDKTARMRELNDQFRSTLAGGKVYMTDGVGALPPFVKARAIEAVTRFDAFTGDNDPHREHDFGAFEIDGHKLFWKLDYHNLDMSAGSEDPSDPAQTTRVLTLMLAEDY